MTNRTCALALALGVMFGSMRVDAQSPGAPYTFHTLASTRWSSVARFNGPRGVAVDGASTVYVADTDNHTIRKITPAGVVTTLAGSAGLPGAADGVGAAAQFYAPAGIAVDSAGTLFVADTGNHTIRAVTPAGVVSTIAGAAGSSGSADGNGGAARFSHPRGVAVDGAGVLYVADTDNETIRKITPAGAVTTLAGSPGASGSTDASGAAARFYGPTGLAIDAAGVLYVADTSNNAVRKVTGAGAVTTLAGGGGPGPLPPILFSPEGVAVDSSNTVYVVDLVSVKKITAAGAVSSVAGFAFAYGIAVDASGTLYVAYTAGETIDKIAMPGAIVSTLAGEPGVSGSGDGGSGGGITGVTVNSAAVVHAADPTSHVVWKVTSTGTVSALAGLTGTAGSSDSSAGARFYQPAGVAADLAGNLYVADTSNSTIRKLTPAGAASTLGLGGASGSADGSGGLARFNHPRGIAVDAAGTLYVADTANHTIRKITPAGVVSTLAGLAGSSGSTDGTGSAARFTFPAALAIDGTGTVYVGDSTTIRTITPGGVVGTLAGLGGTPGSTDGTGSAARFSGVLAVTVDASGTLYVTDNHTVRRVTASGVVTTLAGTAGSSGSSDGTGSVARFFSPQGIAVDAAGTVYVADTLNHKIRAMTPAGVVTTFAGGGGNGSTDGTGTAARFFSPMGLAFDAAGTLYVADSNNDTVRAITPAAVVSTRAGLAGASGSTDGAGSDARFSGPAGMATSGGGTLYVADTGNHTIRSITAAGLVATFAGSAGASGGADGAASAARFSAPKGVAVDAAGTVYVADTGNHTVRAITAAGVVSTLAGSAGTSGSANGVGSVARFLNPAGVAVDSAGTVYVADTGNHTIRTITPAGEVTTLAGLAGMSGSVDGAGGAARFNAPVGLAVDGGGTVYVADTGNHTVRAITAGGVVSTLGGLAGSSGNADGIGSDARFNAPNGIVIDSTGTLYVADTGNQSVRQGVLGAATAPTITTQPVAQGVRQGQNAQFAVTAIGNPAPGYQWQVVRDTGTWQNLADGDFASSGANTPTLTVNASLSLNGSQFRCVVSSTAGSVTSSAATLTVYHLTTSPSSLFFAATQGPVPPSPGPLVAVTPAQTVNVAYGGPGEQPMWTASADQPWIQITTPSGTGGGSFSVSIQSGFPFTPSQTATITVTAPNLGLTNTLPVSLGVKPVGTSSSPFGVVDTPAKGATGVVGAIPVTGWALDDIGVNRVEVWRNCLEAIDRSRSACVSPAAGLPADYVFLGKAFLLAGARPDVELVFSGYHYPLAYRAGWGFMVLTNGLPHQIKGTTEGGQGSYALSAFAIDEESHAALLGTKTIAVDNDHATVPFGAIDTPAQGGTIPEAAPPYNDVNAYPAFGWAMTQLGKCLDTTSTTAYKVFIDGVARPLTAGMNWFAGLNRSDLAAAYPGLCNSTNALAVYYVNAGALGLASGLHTISWGVTDNGGNTTGIGSRFFNVVASSGDAAVASVSSRTTARDPYVASGSSRTVLLRLGGADGPAEPVAPDAAGHRYVQFAIGQRLHLDLGGPVDAGYQQVGSDVVRALPVGSTLDAAAGAFAWEPPAGFFGPFELIFTAGGERIGLTVTIVDGTRATGAIAMHVDAPLNNSITTGTLTVAGWALDPQATTGSGIDTIHVWAFRRDVAASAPQFLGAATLNVPRPDVAQAFGAQFHSAGFQLGAPPLAPGMYDLVAYAWSHRTGRWEDARTVRVTIR